jgi:hypothetical protein
MASEGSPSLVDILFVFVATLLSPDAGRTALGTRASWRKGGGAIDIAKALLVCRAARRMVKQIRSAHLTTIGLLRIGLKKPSNHRRC